MRTLKILELNAKYFPGNEGQLTVTLICAKAGLTCEPFTHGDGFMVAVPSGRIAASRNVPHALAQLLLWARERHQADWIWFDPSNPDTDPELEGLLS